MKNLAKETGEYWRGGRASLRFLGGLPGLLMQVARKAQDQEQARDQVIDHFRRFLDTCGLRVSVEGTIPEPGTGCIVCHNETSFVDIAAYFVAVWPHIDRLAGADIYGYLPFSRAAFRKIDIDLVARGNRQATEALMGRMVTTVTQGGRVGWGGEGRLSGVDGIGPFKVGGSLIAIRAQAPVIPVVIQGGHDAMPLGSFRARAGEVRVRFCDPVPTLGCAEADARGFADSLQAGVLRTYKDLSERRRIAS